MREVLIYGGLLAALLVGAWFQHNADPPADDEEGVVMIAGDADDLTRIVWKGDAGTVTIDRKTDDHGDYLWVVHEKEEERTIPPEVSADGEEPELPLPPPEVETIVTRKVFKASDKGDELVADLSPLRALRRLDDVDDDKRAQIGLTEPTGSLELTRGGKTTTVQIGAEAYGTKDLYVQTEAGEIFLVDDQVLKTLEYAQTRLPDRDLWSFDKPGIQRATITMGERSRTVEQKNPDDPKASTWADADGSSDEQIQTWLDKVLKLRGTTYVDPDDEDAPTDLQLRFSLTLAPSAKDDKAETVEILQDGEDGDWYGRSEHTRGTLKLLKAPTKAVAEDVEGLVQ
ncbi:MAG: DUF4340 domain-containing protein [Alphaproteobacteria bacterium]|nr:DUF4340 domain-containing protein [Alphaproteobacteria bacterium]